MELANFAHYGDDDDDNSHENECVHNWRLAASENAFISFKVY